MKKILSLFALGLMASAGAMAQQVVTTPRVSSATTKYYYTFYCQSTDAHLDAHHLGEVGGVLTGRAATGTLFEFVSNGSEDQYYIKSKESGKFMNSNGTTVTLDETANTYWTVGAVTDAHGTTGVGLHPNGIANGLNNNGAEGSGYLQFRATGTTNYCSLWTMQEYATQVSGSITDIANLSNDVVYTIESNRRGWWTAKAGSNNIWQTHGINDQGNAFTSDSGKAQDASDADQKWAILKSEQGNYYLYNVGQQKFFTSSTSRANLAEDPNEAVVLSNQTGTCTGTWLTSAPDVCWAIGISSHWFGVTNWAGQGWQVFQNDNDFAKNNDEGMYFRINAREEIDPAVKAAALSKIEALEALPCITYNLTINGQPAGSVEVEGELGAAYPHLVEVPAYCTVVAYPDGTVSGDETLALELTQELPFELGKVYHLGVRLNDNGTLNKYVRANGSATQTGSYGNEFNKGAFWYFTRVENTADQFYLNNVLKGGVSTANGSASAFGTATPLQIYEYNGAGHQNGNADFGFVNANKKSDVYGDHNGGNTQIGYWAGGSKTDKGSAFRVVEISDAELDALPTEAPEDPYVGYVGSHAAIDALVYNTADIAAVKADATVAAVNALFDNASNEGIAAYTVDLDFNKIYRIVDFFGRVANAAPVADAEGTLSNKGTIVTAGKKDADTFFRFVEAGDNVKIQHVNSGLYFGTPGHGSQIQFVEEAEAAEFAMTPKAGANLKWLFKKGSEYINNNSTLNRFDGWNSDGDGSQLNVVEVGALPVTIGEAGFATLCSPVNLTVPEEVTVYTAKLEGNYLVAEVLKNHIPAGAAVILEAAAGTYNFQFVSGAAPVENNDLLGTCVAKVKTDGDLVLGNEGGLGFYSLAEDVANLAANKAYIHVDPAVASNLRLSFGELTSILSAVKENGGQAIFDLQGRRVVSAKGITIQNGKKVIK